MRYWKAVRKINQTTFQTGGIGGSTQTTFKVGQTYEVQGEPELCQNGFHFYVSTNFVFGINLFNNQTGFLEIEPLSKVTSDTQKCVATKIKVLRYIPLKEWHQLINRNGNSGDENSGYRNSGNRNSGNGNSGNGNSGNRNSGDRNSGDRNSGDRNSGDRNSGNGNSGYRNSGNRNSGDRNSGNGNSGNGNSGNGYNNFFCTQTKYFLFDIKVTKEVINTVNSISMYWFSLENKTYKQAWSYCPDKILEQFHNIKEFQTKEAKEKFLEITGLIL